MVLCVKDICDGCEVSHLNCFTQSGVILQVCESNYYIKMNHCLDGAPHTHTLWCHTIV